MDRRIKQVIVFFLCHAWVLGMPHAQAVVYLNPEQAMELAFPDANEVQTHTVTLDPELKARIQERAKNRVLFSKIEIHTGIRKGEPMGYAMIHNVKGKVRPITFMLVIEPDGKVQRVEILAYRESHGGEIRHPSFLKQFVGKNVSDPIRNKRDIRNISGATISCRAIADGVRTLVALWEEVYPAREGSGRDGE